MPLTQRSAGWQPRCPVFRTLALPGGFNIASLQRSVRRASSFWSTGKRLGASRRPYPLADTLQGAPGFGGGRREPLPPGASGDAQPDPATLR